MGPLLITIGIILAIVLFIGGIFNMLTRRRNYVKEAWAQIDVMLQEKFSVFPNLVKIASKHAQEERATLEAVTKMRSFNSNATSQKEKMEINNQMTDALPQLLAISENYPQLKSDKSFINLMDSIKGLEAKITSMRTRYNGAVTKYNNYRSTFPAIIFANSFGFQDEPFFEITSEKREETNQLAVDDYF